MTLSPEVVGSMLLRKICMDVEASRAAEELGGD